MEWLNSIAGPQYASAVMWTVGALVLLVIVLFLVRVVRGVSSGTFVAGGRNRRTRLAVMDAAAIDNQRRLVLVRRDDVEHLILIGGPTDVVVEQNIVPGAVLRTPPIQPGSDVPNGRDERPAPEPAPAPDRQPRAALRERQEPIVAREPVPAVETPAPVAVAPAPMARQNTEATVSPPAGPSGSVHFLDKTRIAPVAAAAGVSSAATAAYETEPRNAEIRAPEIPMPEHEAAAAPQASHGKAERETEPPRGAARGADLDAALREELKAPLVNVPEARQTAEPSLEEEMKRLLGELSVPARN